MMGYAGMAYPQSAAAYQMAAYQQAAASAAASQQAAAAAAYQQPAAAPQESYQAAGAAAYGGYSMPAAQPPVQLPVDEAVGQEAHIQVAGCTHPTVGPIVRGNFTLNGQNHGKPTYKKDSQVNGLDVQLYFWDERDGPNFCGWWFGPKVGGDQVWAYHPSKVTTPPKSGWKVPYDGPIDTTFALSAVTVQSYGAYGQPAAAASYGQPAQQALAYGQQPAAYGQQAQPAQPSWQQAQQDYQQQQYQQQQQQQQAEQQRKQQLEQQRQMQLLEAQKKQQEELRKRQQQEELRQRMEQAQRLRQEELRRQADLQRRQQEEMKAAMKIRTIMQKLRLVTPETYAVVEKELQAIRLKELPNCGSQAAAVADECIKAMESARIAVESILAQRKVDEENRIEGLKKHKELQENALTLLKELEGLMVLAEESFSGLKETAAALVDDPTVDLEQVDSLKVDVEAAAVKTQEKIKACQEFFITNGPAIKVPDLAGMAPCDNKQIQQKITQRLTETIRSKDALMKSVEAAKSKAIRRGEALAKLKKYKASFAKYLPKGKDLMDKVAVKKYAKGEFKIELTPEAVEQIWKYVLQDGNQGIKVEQHQRLKVAVGVAREMEQDAERKKVRLELEKLLEEKKTALKEEVDEVSKKVDELEESISKSETAVQGLQKKADPAAPLSVTETIAKCDETDELVKAAREQVVEVRLALKSIGGEEDLQPELKQWLMLQARPVEGRIGLAEPRLFRVMNVSSRNRQEAKKKDADELAALEKRVLAVMKYHQTEKKLANQDLFKAIIGKANGIKEAAWLAFFKKAEKKPKAEEESSDAKAEEDLTQEELKRVYKALDDEKSGSVSVEQFKIFIGAYLKVVKETVISAAEDTASESLRKLEVGEVVELSGATPSGGEIVRAHVKALKDDLEGWVTISGNQGSVFLIPGGTVFKVVKETFLTGDLELEPEEEGKPASERKLRFGEHVVVRHSAKKDEKSGALRLKCKAKLDGAIGWASVSNGTTVFLQVL